MDGRGQPDPRFGHAPDHATRSGRPSTVKNVEDGAGAQKPAFRQLDVGAPRQTRPGRAPRVRGVLDRLVQKERAQTASARHRQGGPIAFAEGFLHGLQGNAVPAKARVEFGQGIRGETLVGVDQQARARRRAPRRAETLAVERDGFPPVQFQLQKTPPRPRRPPRRRADGKRRPGRHRQNRLGRAKAPAPEIGAGLPLEPGEGVPQGRLKGAHGGGPPGLRPPGFIHPRGGLPDVPSAKARGEPSQSGGEGGAGLLGHGQGRRRLAPALDAARQNKAHQDVVGVGFPSQGGDERAAQGPPDRRDRRSVQAGRGFHGIRAGVGRSKRFYRRRSRRGSRPRAPGPAFCGRTPGARYETRGRPPTNSRRLRTSSHG